MADKVKIAVIGLGNMGVPHVRDISTMDNLTLVGVCDTDKAKADNIAAQFKTTAYYDYKSLFDKSGVEAIIIATPHYDHTIIAVEAFARGIHVLTEKPIAVHVNDAKKMIAAWEDAKKKNPKIIFCAMFMQRTYGFWQKIKSLIDNGDLGKLMRATWIITDWYRTQQYYDSGGWRATWAGEGGGVLMNQCPHNLDLYQWFFGVPDRVTGFVTLGKYHNIEVEDEVTAYFEYKNGMVGHFLTTTAEAPGTNRLEIIGENGKLVYENGKMLFTQNRIPVFKHLKEAATGFDKPEAWNCEIPYKHHGQPGHRIIIDNFANAILKGEKLLAPAEQGINSVMMNNAIMLSSFEKKTIDLPMQGDAFEAKLKDLIKGSKFKKEVKGGGPVNMNSSF
ncbi:MAG: Gfo/Idh/MocA family oxidoreductase [Spirochaetes bacterium]|nr:Gfo/Idh/MocA family oxidoreductase [Spirochaetota bacterium]